MQKITTIYDWITLKQRMLNLHHARKHLHTCVTTNTIDESKIEHAKRVLASCQMQFDEMVDGVLLYGGKPPTQPPQLR